jgi:hypothetical protein
MSRISNPFVATADEAVLGVAYRIDPRFPSREGPVVTEWQHLDHPDRHWFQGQPSPAAHQRDLDMGHGWQGTCLVCEHCGTVIGSLYIHP